MNVEFALFDGDELLDRDTLFISSEKQNTQFKLFAARYQIKDGSATIELDQFHELCKLKQTILTVPVHESGDWESIDLGHLNLAFCCRLNA